MTSPIKPYKPETDGVDHINAYSRGETWLGVELSNFSFSPFKHPDHGSFASLEAYWFWLQTEDDGLRDLHGYEAKKAGEKSRKINNLCHADSAYFKGHIKEALRLKIHSRPKLTEALKESSLPIVHYYVRKSEEGETFPVHLMSHRWVWHEIECIRAEMKGEPMPESRDDSKSEKSEPQMGLF